MKKIILAASALIIITACNQPSKQKMSLDEPTLASYFTPVDSGIQSGGIRMIPIQTPRGTFTIWTKRFGNNPKIKVLLLHGGPGVTHEYFECVENFFPVEGIEFIYYDQLGSGNSDHPDDTSLWDLPRFVEEVEQVRVALGLNKDNFYLLGHSWGGILAMEYALKYQEHIKGLIISDMMSSAPDYGKYADEILSKQMDPKVLDTIRMIEAKGDYQNPKYMELLMENFYVRHILRMPADKWPDPVKRTFSHINQTLYAEMQGPSEFGISGKLEKWDRSQDLKNISVPTLVIGATYDSMDPEHMKWMSTQFPNGKFLLCTNGSHMCMWDDQKIWMNGVMQFIQDVNAGDK